MGLQRGFYEIGQLQKGTPKICAIADSDQLHFGTPAITSIRHEPLSIFLMAVIADQKGKKAHRVKFYNPELEIFEDSSHL